MKVFYYALNGELNWLAYSCITSFFGNTTKVFFTDNDFSSDLLSKEKDDLKLILDTCDLVVAEPFIKIKSHYLTDLVLLTSHQVNLPVLMLNLERKYSDFSVRSLDRILKIEPDVEVLNNLPFKKGKILWPDICGKSYEYGLGDVKRDKQVRDLLDLKNRNIQYSFSSPLPIIFDEQKRNDIAAEYDVIAGEFSLLQLASLLDNFYRLYNPQIVRPQMISIKTGNRIYNPYTYELEDEYNLEYTGCWEKVVGLKVIKEPFFSAYSNSSLSGFTDYEESNKKKINLILKKDKAYFPKNELYPKK